MIQQMERGWAAHFCASDRCLFRRNTLLKSDKCAVVVSTVGELIEDQQIVKINPFAYYETMAFHVKPDDTRYFDADVTRPIQVVTSHLLEEIDCVLANKMHERVVQEIKRMLKNGVIV